MQARIKIQNETTVVVLSGHVDVETAALFRAALQCELQGKRLVFDFGSLSFVGSQGMMAFLQVFQSLQESNPGSFKFCSVGMEFQKLFVASPLNLIGIHNTIEIAVAAFSNPSTAPHLSTSLQA